jgi:PUA domain protein
MFKIFKSSEDLGNQQLAKSSVVRGIRSSILEQYPRLEHVVDEILPKKDPLMLIKGKGDFAFYTFAVANNEIILFQTKDGPWLPTLRVLHKYPSMMPKPSAKSFNRFSLGNKVWIML